MNAADEREPRYVQPIVILVDRDEPAAADDVIAAAALASTRILERDIDRAGGRDNLGYTWDAWLAQSFTKSIRRADAKALKRIIGEYGEHNLYFHQNIGNAEALAFRPVQDDQMPPLLRRLQVTGTELPESQPAEADAGADVIVLRSDIGMSTGKAAAQAAHALMSRTLSSGTRADGARIVWAESHTFDRILDLAGTRTNAIVDAGRTEINPGTTTAFAVDAETADELQLPESAVSAASPSV